MGSNILNQRLVRCIDANTVNLNSGSATVPFTRAESNFDRLWVISDPTKISINRTGLWLINVFTEFVVDASVTRILNQVKRNGAFIIGAVVTQHFLSSALVNTLIQSPLLELNKGDYIELFAQQFGGAASNLAAGTVMSACLVCPYYPGSGDEER